MARTLRFAALLFLFSINLAAQRSPSLPITATVAGEKIRFTSAATVCRIRVQIVTGAGESLFDSSWKDGNFLDWPVDNSMSEGSYRCIIAVKDLNGRTSERETTLLAHDGHVAIEGPDENAPKVTLLAHDGNNGAIVSTSGDLSFRFGDFLAGKDTERMRLTTDGDLQLEGLVRAKGLVFPDGSVLTTTAGLPANASPSQGARDRGIPAPPAAGRVVVGDVLPRQRPELKPGTNFAPAYQFVIGDTGVSVGTTNPAYRLDVNGVVNSGTEFDLAGVRFAHNYGTANTFLGVFAGNVTLSGFYNTGIGDSSLTHLTTGSDDTAVGNIAANALTSGTANTAIGTSALAADTTASDNTAIGYQALAQATGLSNIAVGFDAGLNITSGSYNVDIDNAGMSADSYTIRIGTSQTRAFIAGIRGVTVGADALNVVIDSSGQLGTTVGIPSSRRYKFDISDMGEVTEGLMSLRPVTFRYLAHGENAPLQYGLIAEEVAEVYPEMVTRNKDGQVDRVIYQFLAPMLLNELQKQHRQIEDQRAQNAELRDQLQQLLQRVEQLEGKRATSR